MLIRVLVGRHDASNITVFYCSPESFTASRCPRGGRTMSEALFLTFQSQLSVVMETVLKSAMFEITRLVEDSFLEEVGHRKQEVEVLKRRLQLSESKLREREREWERGRKTRCLDCGRTGESSSRDESQPVEPVRSEQKLLLLLITSLLTSIHPSILSRYNL